MPSRHGILCPVFLNKWKPLYLTSVYMIQNNQEIIFTNARVKRSNSVVIAMLLKQILHRHISVCFFCILQLTAQLCVFLLYIAIGSSA